MTRLELLEESIKGSRIQHINWAKEIYVYFDKTKDTYINQVGETLIISLSHPEHWQHWKNPKNDYYTIGRYLNKLGIYDMLVCEQYVIARAATNFSLEQNKEIKKQIRNGYPCNAYDIDILDELFKPDYTYFEEYHLQIYYKLKELENKFLYFQKSIKNKLCGIKPEKNNNIKGGDL